MGKVISQAFTFFFISKFRLSIDYYDIKRVWLEISLKQFSKHMKNCCNIWLFTCNRRISKSRIHSIFRFRKKYETNDEEYEIAFHNALNLNLYAIKSEAVKKKLMKDLEKQMKALKKCAEKQF